MVKKNICPKCKYLRKNDFECIKCGIIFSKYKQTNSTIEDHPYNFQNTFKDPIDPPKNKFYIYFSIVYLLLISIDVVFVYNNEYERPKRERLYSTVDFIETSIITMQLKEFKNLIESLHDRKESTSIIFQYIEDGCNKISGGVIIKRTNNSIRCIFPDSSIFSYSAITGNINIKQKKFRHEELFSFFPNIIDLHMIYKEIDFDSKVYELHSMYPNLDYSIIEKKYTQLSESNYYRLFISAFTVWFFPIILYFLIKE